MSDALRIASTLLLSLAGAGVFIAMGLPLPWLLGPMFACLIAALLGFRLQGLPLLSQAMRTVLGVAVGASITPEIFGQLPSMAITLALIPFFIVVAAAAGYPFFRRVCGFDPVTSYYAAMPGGLQDMLVFGEEAGGDVRALGLIHATRVLIIVTILPILMTFWLNLDLNQPPGDPASELPLHEGLLMIALALVGWRGGLIIGLFGASILGPLFLTATASLLDVIHHRPPAEAILAAQFFIGFAVGVKYVGVTVEELRKDVAAGVGFTLILTLLSAVFAGLVIALDLAPTVEAVLAFAPGGQAEMAVLAIVAGADIAFVVAHHLVRIVTVIIGAPLFARWLR